MGYKLWKIALPSKQLFLIPFWCQLASICAPKIHKNPSKNRSQEASQKWSIFGSIFCPSWFHVGTQATLQTVPKRAQDAPKTPRRQPKSHKSTQDQNLVHFWFQSPMGYPPPWPRFSKFIAHFNSIFGAKFALGNLESFTSNLKIQKVNS